MNALSLVYSWGHHPRVHPNGFIQLDFPQRGKRLHIWPGEHIAAQKTRHTIHDHVFDMESRILRGAVTNLTYNFIRSKFAPPEYEIFKAVYNDDNHANLISTGEQGHMNLLSNITYPVGAKYALLGFIFHDSLARGITVTVMNKSNQREPREPRIAVPLGVVPDNEYRRDSHNENFLWGLVERALDGLDEGDILR